MLIFHLYILGSTCLRKAVDIVLSRPDPTGLRKAAGFGISRHVYMYSHRPISLRCVRAHAKGWPYRAHEHRRYCTSVDRVLLTDWIRHLGNPEGRGGARVSASTVNVGVKHLP